MLSDRDLCLRRPQSPSPYLTGSMPEPAGQGYGAARENPAFQEPVSGWNAFYDYDIQKSYLARALEQIVLGNLTEEFTLLGTVGEIALSFIGLDLPGDLRDLFADLSDCQPQKLSWWGLLAIDAIGLLPVVGVLKNTDEVVLGLKRCGDNLGSLWKGIRRHSRYADEFFAMGKLTLKGAEESLSGVAAFIQTDIIAKTRKHLSEYTKGMEAYVKSNLWEPGLQKLEEGKCLLAEAWEKLGFKKTGSAVEGGSDVVKGGSGADIGYMKNNADPMREILGPGKVSSPDEWNSILKQLEESGVEVKFRDGNMAYAPGLVDGSPGQIVIDPDASLSALKHEYRHFLDSQAEGFPSFGKQMFEDPKSRAIKELRAYMEEIKEADRLGLKDASAQLFENYRQEREWIVNQYIMISRNTD